MFTCPHCFAPAIGRWRKFNASSTFPAVCPKCGGLSFVSAWAHAGTALVLEVLLWGSIIAALVLKSWYALLLFPAGVVFWALIIGQASGLQSIEPTAVLAARRSALYHAAGAFLLIGGATFFFGAK